MTDLPLLTFLDSDQNAGPFETGFIAPQLDFQKERPGGSVEDTQDIVAGVITPAVGESRAIQVDTQAAAATDELDFITNTNVPVGAEVELRSTNTARVIEMRHNQSGAGKMLLRDGVSYFLDDPDKRIRFKRVGTDFEEIWRSHHILQPPNGLATTSGTSVDRTGISANARRITVLPDLISTSGTSFPILQLGTSSSFETSGYAGQASTQIGTTNFTDGIPFFRGTWGAASEITGGIITLTKVNAASNVWVASGAVFAGNIVVSVASRKALSGVLTRVRLTTQGGTDTFDAGAIDISEE